MSRSLAVTVLISMACLLSCGVPPAPAPLHTDSINLVLGDESFVARFGRLPTPEDDEDLRIRVHLEYVLELLRRRSTAELTPDARAARERSLERLAAYTQRGEFPRDDDHPDARRPTFIDSRGRICAVGYLLEQDLGRQAAAAIAAGFKYAFLREIDSPVLTAWAATSGLTPEELEMVQPTYADPQYEQGPFFALLDQLDARGHVSFTSGLLFDGRGDGVPVRLDLSLATGGGDRDGTFGLYADASLTKLTGAARAASALSNLDLGMFYARGLPFDGWLVLSGGLLLPTGDEDEVGAALNSAVAARRMTQAVLFQPGALGGRLGTSLLLLRAFCASCSLRLDGGLEVYSAFSKPWQLSPRWGVGFAYEAQPLVATLEVVGARFAETLASASAIHHAAGGSLRLVTRRAESLQPGISFSMPLEGWPERWFLAFDLVLRW